MQLSDLHPSRRLYKLAGNSLLITFIIFALFGIAAAIFFTSPLYPMHHITVLRLIRSFVFTAVSLFLLGTLSGEVNPWGSIHREKYYFALFITALWFFLYCSVFAQIPDYFQNDIGNYFIFPCLFFSIILLLQVFISKANHKRILCTMAGSILFILISSAVTYVFYFAVYHQEMDEYVMLSILATTKDEARNYLTSVLSLPLLIGGIVLAVVCLLVLILGFCKTTMTSWNVPLSKKKAILIPLFFCYFFVNYLCSIFPLDRVIHLHNKRGPIQAFIDLQRNTEKNAEKITFSDTAQLSSSKTPGTIILVIGESANREHMSAFTKLNEDTTPWEKQMVNQPGFYFFDKAYANFPNTIMAVTQALTSTNQYNKKKLSEAVDVINIAERAGYNTYWISTQEKSNVSEAGITVLANQADKTVWLKKQPDEYVLEILKTIPAEENNFIVIHLMGSHFRYDLRIPPEFIEEMRWKPYGKDKKEIWYHRSLTYTDRVLQDIFTYSQKRFPLQSMVYVSDHGEDMEYTHTAKPFKFSMVRIPLWIYLSPQYRKAYPETSSALEKHQHTAFTNDLTYELMVGLIHCQPPHYQKEYDISNEAYNLNRDTALTLHGKKFIKEEDKEQGL